MSGRIFQKTAKPSSLNKDSSFVFDTAVLSEALGGEGIDNPEILSFVEDMIDENINEIKNGGVIK